MVFFIKNGLILCFFLLLVACEFLGFGKTIDIKEDLVMKDLLSEISMLKGESSKLNDNEEKIQKFLKNQENVEADLQMAIQKERLESEFWQKRIFEQLAYRKVRLNKRLRRLMDRQKRNLLTQEELDKDAKEYFQDKKLNPIKKGWENRFRAAIDL